MTTQIAPDQVSLTVHDRISCQPGDVITLWLYTTSPVTLDGVTGSANVPTSGDGATSLTNYMSVTHDSYL